MICSHSHGHDIRPVLGIALSPVIVAPGKYRSVLKHHGAMSRAFIADNGEGSDWVDAFHQSILVCFYSFDGTFGIDSAVIPQRKENVAATGDIDDVRPLLVGTIAAGNAGNGTVGCERTAVVCHDIVFVLRFFRISSIVSRFRIHRQDCAIHF